MENFHMTTFQQFWIFTSMSTIKDLSSNSRIYSLICSLELSARFVAHKLLVACDDVKIKFFEQFAA